jgi:hypothetical protein
MKALQFAASLAIASVSLAPFTGLQATATETTPAKRSQPTIQVTEPTADPQIGLLFAVRNRPDPSDPVNLAYLVEKKYVGRCAGNSEPEAVAKFYSKTRKPAPGLRVIVRNVSFGFAGETRPNTDREYYNGDISEGFLIKYGDQHSGRYLAVQPGNNEFDYVIKSGKDILESGKFSVKFDNKSTTEYRHGTPVVESYCADHHKEKEGNCVYQTRTVFHCN